MSFLLHEHWHCLHTYMAGTAEMHNSIILQDHNRLADIRLHAAKHRRRYFRIHVFLACYLGLSGRTGRNLQNSKSKCTPRDNDCTDRRWNYLL